MKKGSTGGTAELVGGGERTAELLRRLRMALKGHQPDRLSRFVGRGAAPRRRTLADRVGSDERADVVHVFHVGHEPHITRHRAAEGAPSITSFAPKMELHIRRRSDRRRPSVAPAQLGLGVERRKLLCIGNRTLLHAGVAAPLTARVVRS